MGDVIKDALANKRREVVGSSLGSSRVSRGKNFPGL